MNRRPLSITLIAGLFTALGVAELVFGISKIHQRLGGDDALMLVVGIVALAGGILAYRGSNWGRWLILAWLAFHVALSIFHPTEHLVAHSLILALLAFFLFRPRASAYFR